MRTLEKRMTVLSASVLMFLPFTMLILNNILLLSNVIILFLASAASIYGILEKNKEKHASALLKDQTFMPLSPQSANHQYFSEQVAKLSQKIGMPPPAIRIAKRLNDIPEISIHCLAFPFYTIIISADLLDRIHDVMDESQLQFLIAHELGHFQDKDHWSSGWLAFCQGNYVIQSLITIGSSLTLGFSHFGLYLAWLSLGFMVQLFLTQRHSRICELTADEFALQICDHDVKLPKIFSHISKEYYYWGIVRYQNAFAEFKIYKSDTLAPLLERLYHLEKKLTLSMPQQTEVSAIKREILSRYPFTRNQEDDIWSSVRCWFNSQPTIQERKSYLSAKLKN